MRQLVICSGPLELWNDFGGEALPRRHGLPRIGVLCGPDDDQPFETERLELLQPL
jgi:hypothetical protein